MVSNCAMKRTAQSLSLSGQIWCEPNGGKDESLETSDALSFLVLSFWVLRTRRAALADATSFKVPLTGAQCVPPVDTTGSGTAELTYDPATRVVTWNIAYSWAVERVDDGSFPRPGQARPKCAARDLAQHSGQSACEPDERDRHAHPGSGEAVLRRRVVRQRAQSIASCRGNPRSGHSSQELRAKS